MSTGSRELSSEMSTGSRELSSEISTGSRPCVRPSVEHLWDTSEVCFGPHLGHFWDHLLGHFWGKIGIHLDNIWDTYGILLGWHFWRYFWGHFRDTIGDTFGDTFVQFSGHLPAYLTPGALVEAVGQSLTRRVRISAPEAPETFPDPRTQTRNFTWLQNRRISIAWS